MPPLFTPRFLLMCVFAFTVFVSGFQLFPTVPFRIRDLGGNALLSGFYLGLFTYASALSAPFAGALADRLGRRRTLVFCAGVQVACSVAYGLTTSAAPLLVIAVVHGVFWSGLLSASAAVVAGLIPESRRTEGLAYYGMAPVLATSVGPWIGLQVYEYGWVALCASATLVNIGMLGIAARAVETGTHAPPARRGPLIEWRSLLVGVTVFLPAFGHGGATSFVAMYAAANHVVPPSLYFTVSALAIVLSRPGIARFADRFGHQSILIPCLAVAALGYACLALGGTTSWMIAAAIAGGVGFGTVYPVLAAYLLFRAEPARRGAAFGGLLAMLNIGIGTGSVAAGWLVGRAGYGAAFAAAAVIAALAVPYFLVIDRRLAVRDARSGPVRK